MGDDVGRSEPRLTLGHGKGMLYRMSDTGPGHPPAQPSGRTGQRPDEVLTHSGCEYRGLLPAFIHYFREFIFIIDQLLVCPIASKVINIYMMIP